MFIDLSSWELHKKARLPAGFSALVNIWWKCFQVSGCWSPRPDSCRRMETVRGEADGRCLLMSKELKPEC